MKIIFMLRLKLAGESEFVGAFESYEDLTAGLVTFINDCPLGEEHPVATFDEAIALLDGRGDSEWTITDVALNTIINQGGDQ
jgi:hypothetical protein